MKEKQSYDSVLKESSKPALFIGLDVHKNSWSVSIRSKQIELKTFSQPPSTEALCHFLNKEFPEFEYYSCYEAGFSGFWIHRELESQGIHNIVINPTDIPGTDKEKKRKSDKVDCRKISRGLSNGDLMGIYIPDNSLHEERILVRGRQGLLSDIKRIKNRIKSLLHLLGYSIPEQYDSSYWGKGFRLWLHDQSFYTIQGHEYLGILLGELETIESYKREIDKQIVSLSNGKYQKEVSRLRTIPGIGLLGAITLLTEIGDIHRFSNNEQLHSFVGLIPNVYSSGEKEIVGSITSRHNHYLRPIVIQCAWRAAKTDYRLFADYNQLCKRMKANKAIIRIAKKLLNRVSFVLKNNREYQNKTN
jgi:transposase